MLTEKEFELLRLIYDSEKKMERITFHENDTAKVNEFRDKYADEFNTLLKYQLVEGAINTLCEITITKEGKEELSNYKEKKTSENKNKKDERLVIIGIIIPLIGVILSIIFWLFP
jgi:hypothetical protein